MLATSMLGISLTLRRLSLALCLRVSFKSWLVYQQPFRVTLLCRSAPFEIEPSQSQPLCDEQLEFEGSDGDPFLGEPFLEELSAPVAPSLMTHAQAH